MKNQIIINRKSIYNITIIGVVTAVICILGPISIPIGVVPISFTNLAIFFAAFLLGWKKATISYLIYLLIGFSGIPVFSGFSGGAGKLLGPTGGYLIGFIFLAMISGIFIEMFPRKIYFIIAGMIIGMIVTYAFGTLWLAYQAKISFYAALGIGVFPFLIGDAFKIGLAAVIGSNLRKIGLSIQSN